MLDLNLNVMSSESTQQNSEVLVERFPEGSSGTSNSSVVNADASSNVGDEDSCSTRALAGDSSLFTFNFDILKVGGESSNGKRESGVQNDDAVFLRKEFEFFPVRAGENGGGQCSRSWVDLTFDKQQQLPQHQQKQMPKLQQQQEGRGEGQVMPQASPAVKKSRRGPRSRSSQYRGVTFYRRTGRWESHIW